MNQLFTQFAPDVLWNAHTTQNKMWAHLVRFENGLLWNSSLKSPYLSTWGQRKRTSQFFPALKTMETLQEENPKEPKGWRSMSSFLLYSTKWSQWQLHFLFCCCVVVAGLVVLLFLGSMIFFLTWLSLGLSRDLSLLILWIFQILNKNRIFFIYLHFIVFTG